MNTLVSVVSDSGRLRDVVRYTVLEARDSVGTAAVGIRFLLPVGDGPDALPRPAAEALADRIHDLAAATILGDTAVETTFVTVTAPDTETRVATLVDAVPADAVGIVLMPELAEIDVAAVQAALGRAGRSVPVERSPVERRLVRPPLSFPREYRRTAATFGLSLGFYLALGDPTSAFDVVTGLVSAGLVAVVLAPVAFEAAPTVRSIGRAGRACLFFPYLLYAVVRANLAMAVVVLHPRLPIDPTVVRLPAPEGRLARALLANSITLTPGTLTVDVVEDELVVHTLTAGSRADLEAGGLVRAVSYVVGGSPAGTERGRGQ